MEDPVGTRDELRVTATGQCADAPGGRVDGGPPRLLGVDVARGLAVLGMFGAHLLVTERLVWSDPGTWSAVVDGRSSILFATLAGVSVALLTGRTAPPTGEALVRARLVLLTRAAVVFAIGSLVQFLVVPVSVILEYYAVLFVLCVPLLRWQPRSLLLLAGVLVAVVNPLYHQVLLPLVVARTDGGGVLGELGFTGTYPVLTWSAFVVTGLAVGRLDLTAVRVRAGLVLVGLVLAVAGYTAGSVVGGTPADPTSSAAPAWVTSEGEVAWRDLVPPAEELLGTEPHSNTPAETVASGGFALLVLGLCLLVADRARRLLLPLASVGAMPLTAYCAQLGGIALIADDVGQTADGGAGHWLAFAGTALALCTAWAQLIGRGPLERLVRAVTRRGVRA